MAKRNTPVELQLPPRKFGHETVPCAAYIYPEEMDAYRFGLMDVTLTIALLYRREWQVGVRVYMDAHESIWTQRSTIAHDTHIGTAPVQHDTIVEAIDHARTLLGY